MFTSHFFFNHSQYLKRVEERKYQQKSKTIPAVSTNRKVGQKEEWSAKELPITRKPISFTYTNDQNFPHPVFELDEVLTHLYYFSRGKKVDRKLRIDYTWIHINTFFEVELQSKEYFGLIHDQLRRNEKDRHEREYRSYFYRIIKQLEEKLLLKMKENTIKSTDEYLMRLTPYGTSIIEELLGITPFQNFLYKYHRVMLKIKRYLRRVGRAISQFATILITPVRVFRGIKERLVDTVDTLENRSIGQFYSKPKVTKNIAVFILMKTLVAFLLYGIVLITKDFIGTLFQLRYNTTAKILFSYYSWLVPLFSFSSWFFGLLMMFPVHFFISLYLNKRKRWPYLALKIAYYFITISSIGFFVIIMVGLYG